MSQTPKSKKDPSENTESTPENRVQKELKSREGLSWRNRLTLDMNRTRTFMQNHAELMSPWIGRLYYLSMATHLSAASLALNGVGLAAPVVAITVVTNKLLKEAWDVVRDLKDATEGVDFEKEDEQTEVFRKLEAANERIEQLEQQVVTQKAEHAEETSEYLETIRVQQSAYETQTATNIQMAAALEGTQSSIETLQAGQAELERAVRSLLADRAAGAPSADPRAVNRARYESELSAAESSGHIERKAFNPDKDSFIGYEEVEEEATETHGPSL